MQDLSTPKSDMYLGIFSVVAIFMLAASWIWLKNEPLFHKPQRFNIIFHDVAGLNDNAAVQLNGVPVGSVDSIKLSNDNDVVVGMRITSTKFAAREGSHFEICTNGLVGAKYIKVAPPSGLQQSAAPLLSQSSVVYGENPFQPELILKSVLNNAKDVKLSDLDRRLESGIDRLATAANDVSVLTRQLQPVAVRLSPMLDDSRITVRQFGALASDLRSTTSSINGMLHHSGGKGDLKQTALCAFAAADRLRDTAVILQGTLNNQDIRHDLLDAVHSIDDSTVHIDNAVVGAGRLSLDPAICSDLRGMVHDARDTVQGINCLVNEPLFHNDLHCTMLSVQRAADRFDQVGAQVHKILNKRAPLLQLFFTRPGYIPSSPQFVQSAGCIIK